MKTAWVLCGGGSRGAYEIGVWEALREAGMCPDIVTGTSIGALNGALIVQNDYPAAVHLWENLRIDDVMKDGLDLELTSIMENKQKLTGFLKKYINEKGADNTPLKDMIRTLVDENRLRSSPIDFGLVTVRYPSLQAAEITRSEIPAGQLGDYLIATASCFPAFPIYEFAGQQYIDGGYQDNLPIALALRMGAEQVLAIDLHYRNPVHPLLEKLPQVTVISPSRDLGSFLSFEPEQLRLNRRLGYLDALKGLKMRLGERYCFYPLTPRQELQAEALIRRLVLFQVLLDDSEHPFIDTVWPQNVLLEKLVRGEKASSVQLLVRLTELACALMKKDVHEELKLSEALDEIRLFFSSDTPEMEKENGLFQNLLQQRTTQSLLNVIGRSDRALLCRSLKDQFLRENPERLIRQLHWMAPMMAEEVLIAWLAADLLQNEF